MQARIVCLGNNTFLWRRWIRTLFAIMRRVVLILIIFTLFNSFYHVDAPSVGAGMVVSVPTDVNYFRLQPLPSWGSWQLDNQTLSAVPTTGDGSPDGIAPLAVAKGQHLLRWLGAPFPSLTCRFVVPYHAHQPGQTCQITPLTTSAQDESFLLAFPTRLSFQMLSQEQQQALIVATQAYLQTLTSSTTVSSGERYRYNATAPIQTATQPLRATLSFVLDTDSSSAADCQGYRFGDGCSYPASGEDCRHFCTIQWADRTNYHYWNVAVVTRPTWSYRAISTTHQDASSQSSVARTQGAPQITSLRLDRQDNQWQVATHQPGDSYYDDPNCGSTIYSINTDLSSHSATALKHPVWQFTSARNRALGCLATNSGTDTRIIQRFDVLQAINQDTQQRYPTLPLIEGDGEHLAQNILQSAAFVS